MSGLERNTITLGKVAARSRSSELLELVRMKRGHLVGLGLQVMLWMPKRHRVDEMR